MQQIKALLDKIDSLSIRERGIILAGMIFIMFIVWDSFFMRPQLLEERKILAEMQIKRAEQSVLNVKFQQLVRQEQGDPDAVSRERLAGLKKQLDEIETNVRQSTNHLVSPKNMAMILQTILNKSKGLELTEIKGLGASPLLTRTIPESQNNDANASNSEPAQPPAGSITGGMENAYKHGLVIKFEGDYMSTLAYIQELESLEWGFFWENLEYEVIEYPRGRVAITLYTLSLEKEWIGV